MTLWELYEANKGPITGIARGLVRTNPQFDAEDLVSKALVRAHSAFDELRVQDDNKLFVVWFGRIMTNIFRDQLRAPAYKRRVREIPEHLHCEYSESEYHRIESDARYESLLAACDLPEFHERVLRMDIEQDVTSREGAAMLGISVPAYKSALYRAHSKCRRVLADLVLQEAA